MSLVTVEHHGRVAVVTLNRPEALNALSSGLLAGIREAFSDLAQREDTLVAILTGAGRAFCAGADLKALASGEGRLQAREDVEGAGHNRYGLRPFPGPIIAAINGFAFTGGLELALCCDIRIAASTAKLADTHVRVGVIPGGLASALLPRLIGPGRAKMMSLSGDPIDAATAERWGLVDRVVEPDELMPHCLKLAHDIAANDARMVRTYNALISENYGLSYADAVDNEHRRSTDANQSFDRSRVDLKGMAERARGA